jgi:glycosyltransferase involved in cell wall biosynthesis
MARSHTFLIGKANTMDPLVSVVIPTRNRPEMVLRAVRSALAQTWINLEVIVVIDGPDPDTIHALEGIKDARIRAVTNGESVGGAEARNIGVRSAEGEWIAFLDDDDEWFSQKIDKQMALALAVPDKLSCISCHFIERTERGDRILPLRDPDLNEPLSEYLHCPKGFSLGEGFLQTSTLLIPRHILIRVPFIAGLKCGQEYSWLLKATHDLGLRVIVAPDTLSLFNDEATRPRISSAPNWRPLHEWSRDNRACFTRKAYAFFLAGSCVPYAVRSKEGQAVFLQLLAECFTLGYPTLKCLALFLVRWAVPIAIRQKTGRLLYS